MDSGTEKNLYNEVFIGARSLDQVDMILPTYDLLLEQIEQIRNASVNSNNKDKTINKKENNNTIGIFGERGTGKTSVLYTIMEELENERDSNIILPIIEPDNFGENTKIIGSIVGLLSNAVDEELEYIKNELNKNEKEKYYEDFFYNCTYKENNPLSLKCKKLIEYYMYTENEYRKLLANNFDDIATHIEKISYLLTPDIEFKNKLSDLIDELIESKNNRKKCSKQEAPMIFIFIDDIDLKTTKCRELIDSVLQYSNHPNVITFLSGDYDILKEAITLSLIADEDLRDSNLTVRSKINTEKNILARKSYLANEYLKKIIPPARRHNLISWNIENIPRFAFGKTSLLEQLDSFMGERNLFAYEDTTENLNPINSSYSIFDKTPRGLINVYYHIHQIINSKNDKDYFKNIKSLIDTIIVSSKELVDEQKNFFEKILLWGNIPENTFIDYNEILNYNKNVDKNGETTYRVHKNLFNFFIICEILKVLIEDVAYIESDYVKLKNIVLEILYLDPKNKLKNEKIKITSIQTSQNGITGKDLKYLQQVILPLSEIISFKSASMILQDLVSGEFKEDYYYNYMYYKDNEYEKNKNTFISIYNIVTRKGNENLLKEMYLKNYNDNYKTLNTTFNFLNTMCSTTSEYERNEKIFKPLLESISEFKDEKLYQNDNKKLKLTKMLLINTLIKIQQFSKEEIEEKLKGLELLNKSGKDYKEFKFIQKLNDDRNISNNKLDDKKQKNLKRVIDSLGKNICKYIFDNTQEFKLELNINQTEHFEYGIKEFCNGKDGYSRKTVYSSAKKVVNEILEKDSNINIEDYTNIFENIENLSLNNRVWYGRSESIKFLSILKQQFYLDLDVLKEKIPIIYELAIYLKESDQTIKQYDEFERIKTHMREMLEDALSNAKKEIESELDEIGSNLTEEESYEADVND